MMGEKTYRAIRHDIVRKNQDENANEVHHPKEKINQILKFMSGNNNKILELFCGRENLTKHYKKFGEVELYDKKWKKTGDSFIQFHRLIGERKKYNVIDLDSYGFPNRFFPDIYLLIENGLIFVTMPKPYVNILNGITQTHLISYYGEYNPKLEKILNKFALWGLCHWRKVEVLDVIDCKSVWRIALRVERVKATEYTNTRNR
tara:strand:+ start:3517 stop:4125 length:609 start_codon:yes stop_codon:yes gene_type:complete